jgi:hypothetical protein
VRFAFPLADVVSPDTYNRADHPFFIKIDGFSSPVSAVWSQLGPVPGIIPEEHNPGIGLYTERLFFHEPADVAVIGIYDQNISQQDKNEDQAEYE